MQLFDKDTINQVIWDMFEVACDEIADSETAIYGALMAKKDSGLPSDGFFDIFKNKRLNTAGGFIISDVGNIDDANHKQMMTDFERERVYLHASSRAI